MPVPASTTQMGFLPYALGGNLAVRRDTFEASAGFSETLSAGEDVDFSWRLQLARYRIAISDQAVVAKREHTIPKDAFRATWVYGQCTTLLYRRYRARGMRPDLWGAAKAWVWLIVALPGLISHRGALSGCAPSAYALDDWPDQWPNAPSSPRPSGRD